MVHDSFSENKVDLELAKYGIEELDYYLDISCIESIKEIKKIFEDHFDCKISLNMIHAALISFSNEQSGYIKNIDYVKIKY